MKRILVVALLLDILIYVESSNSAPKVQVYTRLPGEYGKENTLICHVSGFHPPEILIELLRNGEPMPDTSQTDLAFYKDWSYHLTRHTRITPGPKDAYSCRVKHLGQTKEHHWENDM